MRDEGIAATACVIALVVDVLTMALVAAGAHGPLRVIAGLVFVSFVPGVAWLSRRCPVDVAGQVAMAIVLSWVTAIVVEDIAAQAAWWHPDATTFGVGGVSAFVLALRLVPSARRQLAS